MSYRGQRALVTGASSGIGAAFARALAQDGADLVLVARSQDKLEALAAELRGRHGVRAEVIAADLARPDAARAVAAAAERGGAVDLLINNAGFGSFGDFSESDDARQAEMVQLNVAAVVGLTRALLPGMRARGRGGIINVASTGAFQPLPYMAVYGATKAFVLSFSEALAAELSGSGVRALALCPGATETAFFDAVGTTEARVGRAEPAERVVARGLSALARGRTHVVSGWLNWLGSLTPRLLPRGLVLKLMRRILVPRRPALVTS